MKRIYLIVLSAFSAYSLNAQVATERFEVTAKNAPKVGGSKPANNVVNAEKVSYLSQDFETWPLTSGWVLSSGPLSTITVPAQQAWHESTNGNPGKGCGILYVNSVDTHDENLITPEVTLPAGGNYRIAFDFSTSQFWHVTPNDNVDITLQASTDGGTTWGDTLWQEDVTALLAASYSDGWETYVYKRAFVNVTAYAGMDVMFRFRYYGVDGAQFTLDNIEVEDIPDNNLAALKVYSGDIIQDFDYSSVPLAQTKPMVIGVVFRNDGVQAQNNVVISGAISFAGSDVYTGSETVSVPVGTTDTVWLTTNYTPSQLGVYTVTFNLPTDDLAGDNEKETTYEVTNFIYAHDFNPTTTRGFNQDDETEIGNLYLMTANGSATAVNIKFGTGTTVGEEVVVSVRGVQTNIQGALDFITEAYYIIQASDLTAPFTIIDFPAPISLTAGSLYLVSVKKQAGPSRVYINANNNLGDDDLSTACFGPFGAASAINWFNGWGWAPHVRLNFDPSASISTIVDATNVTIYPNPSEGNITVSNDQNEENTITVTDVAGKVIYSTTANSETSVDLSKNGTGVYMIEISNANGKKVERVVIR